MKENLRIVKVNTTAFEEEDFLVLTTLNDDQITQVITPIVNAERSGEEYYDNDTLVFALKDKYPKEVVEQYSLDMDKLSV